MSMKSYVDFISDLMKQPALLRELDTVVPFQTQVVMKDWFSARGYALSEADAHLLFQNQSSLLEEKEQVNY